MEKEMTLISAKGKLKGIWGEAVNPIEGMTPLVILAKTGDKDQAYWLSRYLNDAGILTFTFEAEDAASAISGYHRAFDELRNDDRVASEYIVFAGYGEAGNAAAVAASEIGRSVRGIFLMSPVIKDWDKIKGYQGRSYIVAGSDDDQAPLASLEMMAKQLKQGELLQMRGAGHDYREEDLERAGILLRTWVLTGLNEETVKQKKRRRQSMTEVKIVQVSEKDLPELIAISRETFTETFGKDNSPEDMAKFLDENYNEDKLGGEMATPGSFFYFLKADGEVAGYLKLDVDDAQNEEVDPNGLEIERIYLRKSFQHRGLGKQLFEFAEEKGRGWGKSVLWLGVWEHNENAKNFYASRGLTRFSEHVFVLGDDRQTDFLLKKALV